MTVRHSALAFAVLLSAPINAGASKPFSVAEVRNSIRSLNGEKILIRGWVVGCNGGFNCSLVQSLNDIDAPSLTIDFIAAFEPQLTLAAGDEVILKVRVTDECTVNICLDRGPDIVPIRLMKVF